MGSNQNKKSHSEGLGKSKKPDYPDYLTTASDWKAMLKQMKLKHISNTAPKFFQASGGYTMAVKPYSDRTANGLTRCIVDYLTYSGYYANRINSQGQARVKNIPRYSLLSGKVENMQRVTWTKGTTRRGTADVDAVVKSRSLKVEIKIGDDVISGQQLREKLKVESAGGLYYFAWDFPSFLQWFQKVFNVSS